MKIIQDKKEYDIRRLVGKRVKLRYDIEKKEVLIVGYFTHSRLPISLYIVEEYGLYSRNKSSLLDFIKEINFKLKYFQANEDPSTQYTIRHTRELETNLKDIL